MYQLSCTIMSERNGDRARFQKNRKHKLLNRQHIHALTVRLRKQIVDAASSDAASLTMHDEGGPSRSTD